MITDPYLRWWVVLGLRVIFAVVLGTAIVLGMQVAAQASLADADAVAPAVSMLINSI